MFKEKHIYFVRHGQSTANGTGVFQGADAELTELGRRQAAFVAERFVSIPAEVILTSPMPRAHDTAQAIATRTGLPLEEHTMLREYLPPSALIGKAMDTEEGQAYVTQLKAHYDTNPDWRFSGEESYLDLHTRACSVLDHLEQRPESRLVVVSHAGFMRIIFTAMLTEREPNPSTARRLARFLRPENTGITICRYHPEETRRNTWRLITWNDHAHLGETDREEPHESHV